MHALPRWRLSGYYFFYFAFIGVFSPYFGLYLRSLNFSAWEIGLLMSQMQLMRLFGPNVWGWLVDRFGRRVLIIRISSLIALGGFSLFFFLERLSPMLVAMAVLAFFWSAALPLVETLTFDHLREQRGSYSQIRLWGSIGFIVAVMATGALLDFTPPSGVLTACWLVLAGILGVALVLPEAPPHPHAGIDEGITRILRQPRVLALLSACLAMSMAHGAFYIFYSIHLADHGYAKTEVGLLWSLGVLAEIVVFTQMARLSQVYSLRTILLACFVAAVLRFLLMGWGAGSVAVMILVQLLHGLTFGAFHASSIAAVNHWFPSRVQGRGQALYSSLSFGAGGLLGGLLSGRTWDWLGAGWTFSLSAAFALVGGVLVWLWVPRDTPDGAVLQPKSSDPVQ